MKIISRSKLTTRENSLLTKAREAARKSSSDQGHRIGCLIRCRDGREFLGATNIRSRTIGSTCAERMALDQMYFHGNRNPELCVVVGKLPEASWRRKWSDSEICTPCGVCLETFRQATQQLKLKDLKFLCSSWDGKRILRIKLSELFPPVR